MVKRLAVVLASAVAAACMSAGAAAAAVPSSAPKAHAVHAAAHKTCPQRRGSHPAKRTGRCTSPAKPKVVLGRAAAASRRRRPTPKAPVKKGSGTTTPPTSGSGSGTTTPPTSGSGSGTTTPPTSGSGSGTTTPPTSGSGSGTTTPPTSGSGSGSTTPPTSGSGSGSGSTTPPTTWSTFSSHIETWAYDDCGNGGSGASAGLVRAWVSYAESNCGPGGDAKALSDCHSAQTTYCDVIQYLDTNWIYPTDSPTWHPFSSAAAENWYQHTPGSTTSRIQSSGYGGGYLINQANASVQSFFQSYARTNYNADDGLMMDDQSSNLDSQLWYSTCGCGASAETASNAALVSAHEAMSAAMTHTSGQPFTQIDNTLPPNPFLPQGLDMLSRTADVNGLIGEGEPESDGTLDPYYSTLLDQIAYVADETNSFVVPLSYAPAGASYQSQTRRVQEATMLLGYSPGHLVDWADLETGSSDLAVWPEEGIYPTEPVQSMGSPGGSGCLAGSGQVCSTGGHNDLQVAPGVYRREFGACYAQNAAFGACATIVNTTSSPVTIESSWLTRSYAHQVAFTGGDVQSGGAITLNEPATTTVPADDAALLAG